MDSFVQKRKRCIIGLLCLVGCYQLGMEIWKANKSMAWLKPDEMKEMHVNATNTNTNTNTNTTGVGSHEKDQREKSVVEAPRNNYSHDSSAAKEDDGERTSDTNITMTPKRDNRTAESALKNAASIPSDKYSVNSSSTSQSSSGRSKDANRNNTSKRNDGMVVTTKESLNKTTSTSPIYSTKKKTIFRKSINFKHPATFSSQSQHEIISPIGDARTNSAAGTNLEHDLRICRVSPTPDAGQTSIQMKEFGTLPMEYQCAGKPYDSFVEKMWASVAKAKRASRNSNIDNIEHWGKRPFLAPIPTLDVSANINNINSNSSSNSSGLNILFLGHSHARQMFLTLACQYKDQFARIPTPIADADVGNVAMEFHLQNNISIYAAFNPPFLYSRDWLGILERLVIRQPISTLDAIVLGPMHNFAGTAGTTFRSTTLAYQKKHPELKLDFQHVLAPTLPQIAAVFAGPIIYVSPFKAGTEAMYWQAARIAQTLKQTTSKNDNKSDATKHQRTNLRAINGRMHISTILNKTECATDGKGNVSTCYPVGSPRYSLGHRCIGARGGEPDLAAWQVVEALYDVLGSESGNGTHVSATRREEADTAVAGR